MSNICIEAAEASNKFEKNNTSLKKKYLIENIDTINFVMSRTPGYMGSFGTGYPFYALDGMLNGSLPVIDEQLRYNNELLDEGRKLSYKWPCERCLAQNSSKMPDLKQVCKPCPQICDSLKPRKVINRLPDVDMWMVCEDGKVEEAKKYLVNIFDTLDMHTSDVDPVKTIHDVSEIANDLEHGVKPKKMLPLDIHIIEYSKLNQLISDVFPVLYEAIDKETVPYLPIHPLSLRKTWQYDDEAYNFILDFLFSMTPFNFDESMLLRLDLARKAITTCFDEEQLISTLNNVSPDSVKRRFKTPELQKCYERRINSWKK